MNLTLVLPLLLCLSSFTLEAGAPPEDPRALSLKARSLQRKAGGDDPAGAAALYRRVITLEPSSGEAHLRLSEALLEQGLLEEAVAPAERAVALAPKNGEAWAHLGIIHYIRGRQNPEAQVRAQEALEKAARLVPVDAELWTRLAEVAETRRDDASALKAWLHVGRLRPNMTFQGKTLEGIAWERVATLGAQLKQYEARREAVLNLGRQRLPEEKQLRLLEDLAREQAESGFLGHAEESFALLSEHLPKEPAVWENIALVRLRATRFEDALEALLKAEALRPTSRLSFNAAICLMNLGRFTEAEQRLKSLSSTLKPGGETEDLRLLCGQLLGSCLLLQGRPKEVLELSKTWAAPEDRPDFAALKIQALIQTGALKAARIALKEGLAKWPDKGIFTVVAKVPPKLLEESLLRRKGARNVLLQIDLELMAGLHAEFRQWQRSLDLAVEARKASPLEGVDLLLLQANALDQLDRPLDAIQVLRDAQKLKADHPTLQNNLGYLLLEKGGDLKEAAALIEAAVKQEPSNGSTLDSWGWVLFKQGKVSEAEAALRKAVELTPYSPDIRRHLGEVLLSQKRKQEALEQWERALAFTFPERKELEKRTRELRTELAKQDQPSGETPDEPPSEDDEEAP